MGRRSDGPDEGGPEGAGHGPSGHCVRGHCLTPLGSRRTDAEGVAGTMDETSRDRVLRALDGTVSWAAAVGDGTRWSGWPTWSRSPGLSRS